jgi:hypothetical protein
MNSHGYIAIIYSLCMMFACLGLRFSVGAEHEMVVWVGMVFLAIVHAVIQNEEANKDK